MSKNPSDLTLDVISFNRAMKLYIVRVPICSEQDLVSKAAMGVTPVELVSHELDIVDCIRASSMRITMPQD